MTINEVVDRHHQNEFNNHGNLFSKHNTTNMTFRDRHEAAFLLEEQLVEFKNCDGIVVALPRGGVPVGFVIAGSLHLPLQVVPAKKIGHPQNKEYAIGAVTLAGYKVLASIDQVSKSYINEEAERISKLLEKQNSMYNEGRYLKSFEDKIVIVVDDGLATGYTAEAALKYIKSKKPKQLILAVPAASKNALNKLKPLVDKLFCLKQNDDFQAVGQFYQKFDQVEDYEVIDYLNRSEILQF
ncbi:phosphoribosyltransferase family protein [Fulvivirga sp.]|uniref:phosphoribosyltransferase n=1 Tax=Fulvivirga sp. TaxID=1931237 RepID=UPI0032EC9BE6